MRDIFRKRDLKTASAKRKNVLLFSIVGGLFLLLIVSAIMSIDMKGAMKRLNANNEEVPDISEMTEEAETKESWALSVENRLSSIERESKKRTEDMAEDVVSKITESNQLQFNIITGKLEKMQNMIHDQNRKIDTMEKENAKLKLQMKTVMPEHTERLHFSVQTVKNSFVDSNVSKEAKRELTKEEILAQNTYEIVTGFSEAYMITGAVAPLFNGSGGAAGGGGGGAGGASQMLPVPVLLEAEGDLIMPNHVIGSVDKCMLIGTANGNASSSSIDGNIQGWIVSESGTPGIPATLVYRAGDYIARVIASGVLEGLSQGFMNAAASGNYGESQGAQIYAGGYNGMGQGVSNAFSKLADFYLALAESVLPTLEAKAGRTVSMVVMGGDKFQMRDINLLDTREVDMWVNDFIGGEI